jgi:hypothetical protein
MRSPVTWSVDISARGRFEPSEDEIGLIVGPNSSDVVAVVTADTWSRRRITKLQGSEPSNLAATYNKVFNSIALCGKADPGRGGRGAPEISMRD